VLSLGPGKMASVARELNHDRETATRPK
jgi:hypothetical protein